MIDAITKAIEHSMCSVENWASTDEDMRKLMMADVEALLAMRREWLQQSFNGEAGGDASKSLLVNFGKGIKEQYCSGRFVAAVKSQMKRKNL